MKTANKKQDTSTTDKAGVSFNPLLSSRSFWRGKTLLAIDRCRMDIDNRPTLTIGNHYKPILKELMETEFAIIDDEGTCHWFDYSDYEKYFRVTEVAKKNGR